MDFLEKAKVRLEHWISHNEHHQEEYEMFAEQLADAGKKESSEYLLEMVELTKKSTELLRKALTDLQE